MAMDFANLSETSASIMSVLARSDDHESVGWTDTSRS